ncbi:hypothetical protein Tco_0870631 [Tanacetum coccineum]
MLNHNSRLSPKLQNLRFYHRLIVYSIVRRSQAPEKGLKVIVQDLPVIDMTELVRLQICLELDDTWAWVALCKCSSTGRPLGAYNLGVATPRALVYAGLMTSGDDRSWCVLIKANGWFWRLKMCTLGGLGFKTGVLLIKIET